MSGPRWKPLLGVALALALGTHVAPGLAHWPNQPPHQIALLGDLKLEDGGVIKDLKMSYVTHGTLNAAKSNAVLYLHGYGANHHGLDHLIGPGQALDTGDLITAARQQLTHFRHAPRPTRCIFPSPPATVSTVY